MYRLIILSFLVTGTLGQLQHNQTCSATNFGGAPVDFDLLNGTWYQIERIANTNEQGHCSSSTYSNENNSITVVNREIYNKAEILRTGVITTDNTSVASGKFIVTFGTDQYDYYSIIVNYNEHLLLIACRDTSNSTSNIWSWKLSRRTVFSSQSELLINTTAARHPLLGGQNFLVVQHSAEACSGSNNLVGSPFLALITFLVLSRFNKK